MYLLRSVGTERGCVRGWALSMSGSITRNDPPTYTLWVLLSLYWVVTGHP